MTDTFSIKSSQTDRELVFFNSESSDYFSVKLLGSVITDLRVYAYSPHQNDLESWFTELSNQSGPWKNTLSWRSLEGEFEISATCSNLGGVSFDITLDMERLTGEDTIIKTSISTELGVLKSLGSKARGFFK